jgi:hypothetical protein
MRTSGKASNICDVEMMQDAVALCRLHDKEHAQVIISTPMMPETMGTAMAAVLNSLPVTRLLMQQGASPVGQSS